MEISRETTLQSHLASSGPLRPVMTSLNGDNSWLLSFPRPEPQHVSTGKAYYHIVFEPWLNGATGLLSPWFLYIGHGKAPAIRDPGGIIACVRQIEAAAGNDVNINDNDSDPEPRQSEIDAILLGFHYLDHMHEPTLRLFDPSIPVLATPEVVALIKPWNHFNSIHTIPNYNSSTKSWQDRTLRLGSPFPSWLTVIRLPGHHELNYVMAIIWTHDSIDGNEIHEAIMQTPHGTKLDIGPLQAFLDSTPPTEKLALLHGLKESRAGGWLNTYGARGGLALYRCIGGARYWVLTHHSKLWYSGALMWLLWVHDTPRTMPWALEREVKESNKRNEVAQNAPNVVEVDNGACFVLA